MESNLATPVDVTRHEKRSGIFDGWVEVNPAYKAAAKPVASSISAPSFGIWKIALGVLLGNIMTGIIVGLVYAAMR